MANQLGFFQDRKRGCVQVVSPGSSPQFSRSRTLLHQFTKNGYHILSRDRGLKNATKASLFTGLRLHGKLIGKIRVHITAKTFNIRLQTTVNPDELFLSPWRVSLRRKTDLHSPHIVYQFSTEETLMYFLPCIRITSLPFASSSLQHFFYLTNFLMNYNSQIYNLFCIAYIVYWFPSVMKFSYIQILMHVFSI